MNCVLVSFFNSHNIGDIIIADTLYKMVSSKCNVERYSYVGNPCVFTDINDIKSSKSSINNSWKQRGYKILNKYHFTLLISLYRILRRKKDDFTVFESKMRNSDVLIIGGGNMIFDTDKYSDSASYFNEYISVAKKHKKKIFVISIGIGPFKTPRQERNAIDALGRCDYITFRDQKSYEIYKKYKNNTENVFVSVDPVFLLSYDIQSCVSDGIVIGFNVFNNKLIGEKQENYNKVIEGYAKLAKGLSNKLNIKIVLFSTDLTDYEAIYDVYNKLSGNKNIEVREIDGIDSLLKLYSQISMLVGSRMHSMIIAFTQYIPIIGLSWQQKVDAMFDIIDAKDCLFKYDDIESNMDRIITCCSNKLANLHDERSLIKRKLGLIREKAIVDESIILKLAKDIYSK
jgi:polysaccharide pyruvyl transferase WcaK-like protein